MDNTNQKLTIGLTTEEVNKRINEGKVNGTADIRTKSYARILRDNLFSLFNLINLILLICILVAGSPKNGLFFGVVIWNFAIGTIQEIRAKKTIEKLSLISAPKAHVLRNGEASDIDVKDIVLGEITRMGSGDQVCADCVILSGSCQVNESLVTGESEPVNKECGDHLLSGSFLVYGNITAEVEHVGEENYATRITAGAKYVKRSNSVIMKSVKSVVKIIAFALIPLAALMVWKNFFAIDQSFSEGMVAFVSSVSAMVPGGLILLVSTVMTVSVIRLSMHKTLSQDLYCIENLARVDVICLDKTGTITEGKMVVESLEFMDDSTDVNDKIRTFAQLSQDHNSTMEAVRAYFNFSESEILEARNNEGAVRIPFSSETKWSMVFTQESGSIIMGAPEIICPKLKEADESDGLKKRLSECENESKRVVAFAFSDKLVEKDKLPADLEIKAIAVINDKVRENAKQTMEYFEDEKVSLKVISGDNPVTVSSVAVKAGLCGAEKYIDASTLKSYEEIENAVDEYSVFGRVTPYQKLDIVKALKAKGHTVGMIGDGANDVLALKEADCSVAMNAGSDAAKNVANMILLDSDFGSLPFVVAEGRKAINNLQRSAGLYLTKTTYAFILTIFFIFAAFTYPFQSIQVTLIGVVTIGIPSFFLALEPNKERIKKHFLHNVFRMALPSGVLTFAAIMASVLIVKNVLGGTTEQIQTTATFVTIIIGYIVIFDICGRINKWKIALLALIITIAALCILIFPKLFSIATLSGEMWGIIGACCAAFFLIHGIIFRLIIPKLDAKAAE